MRLETKEGNESLELRVHGIMRVVHEDRLGREALFHLWLQY